jgi:Ca2+-binding EF-hand superfamily protein
VDREIAEHEFIDRLFYFWDVDCHGALSFQDLISGLDGVMHNGLMENIEWYFNLHDKNKDGFLTKDEVLTLSESLLVSGMVCVSTKTRYPDAGEVHLPI